MGIDCLRPYASRAKESALNRAAGLRAIVHAAIAASFLTTAAAALAQSSWLRSQTLGADASQADATVESASREAQRAIRACDDNVALRCVADVLTEYAEALKAIHERGERKRRGLRRPANARPAAGDGGNFACERRRSDECGRKPEQRPHFNVMASDRRARMRRP
jgi:hypothetical protein